MSRTSAATVFSTAFGPLYLLCFYFDVALFRYYPEAGQFSFSEHAVVLGPPIVWYGWVGAAAFISGALALTIPTTLATRIPASACWATTVVALLVLFAYETRWFL